MQMFSKVMTIAGIAGLTIAAQLTMAAAARAEDMYGAIATNDETGAWGYAYNYPTQAQAEAAALEQCGKDQGCQVDVWFMNACGAVAKDGRHVGWAWSESKEEAKAKALAACGTGACEIKVWACTDR